MMPSGSFGSHCSVITLERFWPSVLQSSPFSYVTCRPSPGFTADESAHFCVSSMPQPKLLKYGSRMHTVEPVVHAADVGPQKLIK